MTAGLRKEDLADAILRKASAEASSLTAPPLRDRLVKAVFARAHDIARRVTDGPGCSPSWQTKLDDLLTSRALGIPVMLLLLGGVFWLTLVGANIPSRILAGSLFAFEEALSNFWLKAGAPDWFHGMLILGMYRTSAWVVSVMLPPMAVFFPLFTIFEDMGYLPRVAFNLDHFFRRSGAHGKQALTMSMGFGCNAAGVMACRIIESPRERLLAILTNNFVPCNGRFPMLLTLSTIFIGSSVRHSSLASTVAVAALVVAGIAMTFLVSRILTRTILSGVPSAFVLELPPYRQPQVLRVLVRSVFDRTIFVLGRAAAMAAPAGAVIWVLANSFVAGKSLLGHIVAFLDPPARVLGFDGTVLAAFILGLPANETVLPIVVMAYLSAGTLVEPQGLDGLRDLLLARGWTSATAVSVMVFSLLHFPCSTTLWTVYRETRSVKWTVAAAAIPTAVACAVLVLLRMCVLAWKGLFP